MALISKILGRHLYDSMAAQRLCPRLLPLQREKTTATRAKQSPYVIVRPEPENFGEILEVMYDSYFKDEPILKTLGVGKVPNTVLEEEMIKELSEGLSLIARCKFDGCIVGGAINIGTCPWDPDITDKFACTLSDQRMRQLFQFWAYIQRSPNLWNLACTPKIFEIAHIFVLPNDRGKGLAKKLMEESIDTGADCGYTCIRVDASAVATARICEKLGMKLIYEIPYCTYVGANQRPVLDPPPPESSVRTYVLTPHFPKIK